jgi:DNA-3-methyladenine glycosylase I
MENILRCEWPKSSQLMLDYHDKEWGVPLHNDQKLFEFLVLDAFQAGLSWSTILNKRENFRKAFDGFDACKIAMYDQKKIDELMQNAGIVRNKLKIEGTVKNACCYKEIQSKFGSFDQYIWQFTDGKTIKNQWSNIKEMPAKTTQSDLMSKDLISKGFKFVGSTICYAFMQAAGMVNDHLITCFRYNEV